MALVRSAMMVFNAAVDPMLIRARMMRMVREKRMELSGIGVPIVTICKFQRGKAGCEWGVCRIRKRGR